MVRITIELLPLGNEKYKEVLAVGTIANDLTGTRTNENYKYTLSRQRGTRPFRKGTVSGFPRLRKNVWYLLKKVLDDAL